MKSISTFSIPSLHFIYELIDSVSIKINKDVKIKIGSERMKIVSNISNQINGDTHELKNLRSKNAFSFGSISREIWMKSTFQVSYAPKD